MGWGSSTRRGGGRKVRALPRKFVFLEFRREESGMSRNFARMSRNPGVFKRLVRKMFAVFFPNSNLNFLSELYAFYTSFARSKSLFLEDLGAAKQ